MAYNTGPSSQHGLVTLADGGDSFSLPSLFGDGGMVVLGQPNREPTLGAAVDRS